MKKVTIELLVTGEDQLGAVELFCKEITTFTENISDDSIPYLCADLSDLKGKIATATVTVEPEDFSRKYSKF